MRDSWHRKGTCESLAVDPLETSFTAQIPYISEGFWGGYDVFGKMEEASVPPCAHGDNGH